MARTGSLPLPGRATATAPTAARFALAALLLAVGAGDLAVIDLVLLPRHLATDARTGPPSPASPEARAAVALVRAPAAVLPSLAASTPVDAAGEAGAEVEPAPVVAAMAEPPPAPPPVAPEPQSTAPATFPDLLFAINATWLSRSSRETLDQVVAALAHAPDRRAVLSGHTDTSGTPDVNRALARARARRAGRYLHAHGIEVARIEVESFGAERPVSGEVLRPARARNRRVEITVK